MESSYDADCDRLVGQALDATFVRPQAGCSHQLHPFLLASTRQQDCTQVKSTK